MKIKYKKEQNKEIIDSYFEKEKIEVKTKNEITIKKWLHDNWIMVGTIVAIANFTVLIIRYLVAIATVSRRIVSNNPLYIIIGTLGPIIMWVFSTDTEYWNFHNRKIFLIRLCIINAVAVLIQPIYTLAWEVIVENVFKIPVTAAMTKGMIVLLAQLLMSIVVAGTAALVMVFIYPILLSENATKKIKKFKLKHYWDRRKYKEYKYDSKIVKDLETGKDIVIKENDRFVHGLINGASGTGKTSSVYLPAIAQDMQRKAKNKELREKELVNMLLQKEAYIKGPVTEFNEFNVVPKEKYKKKYDEIKKKYPDIGITVIAPNNSIIDDILKLAKAQNLMVNVLDPAEKYENFVNVIKKGINPFYIPFGLDEAERAVRISNAASVFSDVIIAVNEMNGSSDVYFSDISKSVTTNIAVVCMLAANIQGKQTDIIEIQNSIANFELIQQNVKTIETHFNMNVKAPTINSTKGNAGSQVTADNLQKAKNTDKSAKAGKADDKTNPYYQTILFIKSELLGEGAAKMFDQARGLRNLMNKLLGDPRIKEMLSADDDHRIDFDDMLAENSITVVNTALEFGSENSRAFGLFFILTQKVSVLRRPKGKRSMHVIWIDEVSQYMHPALEEMFTLYRQYGVACNIAIQSLSQMEKSNITRYLKGVFMGAGTHIVFGRLSPEEMELYSKMAGASETDETQKTVSQSSMLSDNPSLTTSERTISTIKNKMEGSDIRILDFQEVTILTIDNGRVLEGKFGKVSFLKESDFTQRPKCTPNWEKLKTKIEIIEDKADATSEEKKEKKIEKEKPEKSTESTNISLRIPDNTIVMNVETVVEKDQRAPLTDLKQTHENISFSALLRPPVKEETLEEKKKEEGEKHLDKNQGKDQFHKENEATISFASLLRNSTEKNINEKEGLYRIDDQDDNIDYEEELRKMNIR